jgi:DNA-binding transcriptional ArsR family regulator
MMAFFCSDKIKTLAQRQAAFGKVFSNPQRVRILWLLTQGEQSVSDIASALGSSRPSTSQHLHLMEWHQILESRRDKKKIIYRLAENEWLQHYFVVANFPTSLLSEWNPSRKNDKEYT